MAEGQEWEGVEPLVGEGVGILGQGEGEEEELEEQEDTDGDGPPAKRLCLNWEGEPFHPVQEDSESVSMDNSGEVVSKIAGLYAERLLSDVVLVVGQQQLPAHRLILCASSEVFQIMLMNKNWNEAQEKKIVLKETPACRAVFEVFLKYLYTGKIKVDYANVIPLLQLADKYNVKDLLRVGLEFMSRNIALAAKKNQVVSWFQFTTNCGYQPQASLCLNFIKWNFNLVSSSIDWANLELDSLLHILASSDLVTDGEVTIFRAVECWLAARASEMERLGEENIGIHMERLTHQTIELVRFPMMSPSQLADLLLSPLTSAYMPLMVGRMQAAMGYHKGVAGAVAKITRYPYGDKLLTPRLYTEDKYCASLSVDYFPQLPVYHSRSLVFSSHSSTADHCGENLLEWVVDLYPKGVWFQKCFKIFTSGTMKEVPERVLRTVRASVSTKNEFDEKRVKIGVLVVGEQDGFNHIRHVRTANYIFSENDQIVNFDDLLSFDELNDQKVRSNFLSGINRESLAIHVTITPLDKESSLSIP